jgi:serine/threonine protein kinase
MTFLGYLEDKQAIYVYSILGKPFIDIQKIHKTTHMEKLYVLEQVIKGLIELEKNALYMFDMKPRNVVVVDSTIKIIDLGDVYRL